MARPRYSPTPADINTVVIMARSGFRHEDIARCLGERGIDPKTLRLHFRDELDTAASKANAAVANAVYQKAMSGDLGACCFWLKCRAGWMERSGVEVSGRDGQDMIIRVEYGDKGIPE